MHAPRSRSSASMSASSASVSASASIASRACRFASRSARRSSSTFCSAARSPCAFSRSAYAVGGNSTTGPNSASAASLTVSSFRYGASRRTRSSFERSASSRRCSARACSICCSTASRASLRSTQSRVRTWTVFSSVTASLNDDSASANALPLRRGAQSSTERASSSSRTGPRLPTPAADSNSTWPSLSDASRMLRPPSTRRP